MTLSKRWRKRVILQTNKSMNWNFSESYCGELPSQSSWCGSCPGVLGPNFDSAELLVQGQNGPLPHGSALLCCIQTPPRRMCAEASLPWTQGWHSGKSDFNQILLLINILASLSCVTVLDTESLMLQSPSTLLCKLKYGHTSHWHCPGR